MWQYLILLIVPLLLSHIGRKQNKHGNLCIYTQEPNNSIAIPAFFFSLFLLLALRHESIGRDLPNYKHYFKLFSNMDLFDLDSSGVEIGYKFINIAISKITDNYNVFLAIVAAITVIPIAILYSENRQNSYVKIILFINMSTFIMLFSGIRQSIAIAFGALAFCALKKSKKILFFACAVIACLIHSSGIMVFLIFPLYYFRLKKKHLLVIVPTFLTVFIFNKPIFGFLSTLFVDIYNKGDIMLKPTNSYGSLILFVLFVFFSYIIQDENLMEKDDFALRNMLLMATLLQCFAPLHTLAMRMGYYFIIFVPLVIGRTLQTSKKQYADVAKTAEMVISILFTVIFVYSTYMSTITGISALDTVPYKFFWES